MAKIPLRTYNREIEDLIDHGQIDQAIAHCRHILKFFPKNVDTYRLLGKAYLESQRYGDAADVFQRVLSSVPEDFIAHLGMSIIREDEGNLDEAIWHMERAFEMQPANAAVQGELRRLYGRRDGLEPPKVRLTRGALARMYIKGALYPQAITELRAALAEDPQRPELLALLAQAYQMSGQRVEAADACSNLLSRLPYSLEGNRLLAEILAGSERAAESEGYRQRVQALDPYAAHLSPAATSTESVPAESVTLEKLEWRPGQLSGGTPSQPEWAASLGVKVEGLTSGKETLPDWLSTPSTGAQVFPASAGAQPAESFEPQAPTSTEPARPAAAEGSAAAASAGQTGDEIPSWMRAAGWEPSAADAEGSGPSPFLEEEALDEELAPAEIPDWLRSMAPSGQAAAGEPPATPKETSATSGEPSEPAASPASAGPPVDDFLPWLSEKPPGATDSIVSWLESKEPGQSETPVPSSAAAVPGTSEVPEWLQGLEEPRPDSAQSLPGQAEELPAMPEWLSGGEPEPPAGEIPDWLKGLVEGPEAAPAVAPGAGPDQEEPLVEAGPQPETMGASLSEPASTASPESIQEFDAAKPAGEETPEWLKELGAAAVQPGTAEPSGELAVDAEDEDAAFAWLEGLAARQSAVESLSRSPEEQQETPPEWLQEFAGSTAEESGPVGAVPAEEASLEGGPGITAGSDGALPEWLEAGAGETGPAPAQDQGPEEEPALAAAELPDWLRDLAPDTGKESQEGVFAQEAAGELPPAEPGELPDWLTETTAPLGALAAEGLSSLEEPPVSEEDTKPTRLTQAKEISIPPELAGYVVGAPTFPPEPAVGPGEPFVDLPSVGEIQPVDTGPVEGRVEAFAEIPPEAPADLSIEGSPAETLSPEELPTGEAQTLEAHGVETYPPEETEPVELPDWLRSLEEEPETPWEPIRWASEASAAPSAVEEAGAPESPEPDEAFAWLEGLAARQGADEGLLVSPAERQDTPPDWVSAEAAAPVEASPELSPMADEGSSWPAGETLDAPTEELAGAFRAAEPQETESMEPPTPPEILAAEVGALLVDAAAAAAPELPVSEVPGEFGPVSPAEAAETEPVFEADVTAAEKMAATAFEAESPTQPEAVPELPDWLVGLEETPVEEGPEWTPPAVELPQAGILEASAGTERLDLNRAALIDLERVPGIGFIRAQALLAYRESNGPLANLEALQNVPGFDAETIAQIRDRVMVAVPAEAPVDPQQVALIQARNALAQGDREAALGHYSALLKARALLPDVIRDLHEALYRFPVDIFIWQALGDAYARNDQLQEAIDAYTKAEELLR